MMQLFWAAVLAAHLASTGIIVGALGDGIKRAASPYDTCGRTTFAENVERGQMFRNLSHSLLALLSVTRGLEASLTKRQGIVSA
jgi:hypothetical protein